MYSLGIQNVYAPVEKGFNPIYNENLYTFTYIYYCLEHNKDHLRWISLTSIYKPNLDWISTLMLERDSEAREELLSKLSTIFFRLILNRFAVNQEENYYRVVQVFTYFSETKSKHLYLSDRKRKTNGIFRTSLLLSKLYI